MKQGVTRHEGPDGFERFLAFLDESGRHYNLSCQLVLRHNFSRVLEAIGKIGTRLGVKYLFNSPVSSIQLSDGNREATGVVLESGSIISADSFNTTLPALQCHNVFLAQEYQQSFDVLFKENQIPQEPSFYVHVPNRLDPSASPEGMDALVVLVPVGHLDDEDEAASSTKRQDPEYWAEVAERTKGKVLRAIEERTGMTNLQDKLLKEKVETPVTWKQKYNLDRGAILGISHSFFNVLCFRPKTKHADIDGTFFVGSSTHLGADVPACLAGSKI
ncbi:hypothetical protein N8T08_009841 [Aspergillus melleus]|uniref:Uncharacterized protein n=1 Tax=Aspergillus melleus TaxID=138277 RepID=A0ACC3ATM8_9EURO|nr:hypothetical protein N8T08_009841 [Aspergillus melleus]